MSRPSVFSILHFYEVYLPLIRVKLVSSAHLSIRSSMLHLLRVGSGRFFRLSRQGRNQNSTRATGSKPAIDR
jgi:hypothetical protein